MHSILCAFALLLYRNANVDFYILIQFFFILNLFLVHESFFFHDVAPKAKSWLCPLVKLKIGYVKKYVQRLVINLVIAKGYKFTQYFFLLDLNFDKFIIGLYFLLISSVFIKFLEDQRLIVNYVIN